MFQDYKVVITGATSGIGLATARLFIKEGATVIGIGRNFSKTKDLGDRFIPRTCDVRDADEIVKTCDFIKETFDNELDVFVNNAGFGENTTIRDVTVDQFDRALRQ
ncbi:SDR family oxidoreductase [Enterococcus avium]|uniref:SDR family oxidoreductase n=1 Tax=Enterococcus avium TaxID=33945 RepID=UPI003DA5753C